MGQRWQGIYTVKCKYKCKYLLFYITLSHNNNKILIHTVFLHFDLKQCPTLLSMTNVGMITALGVAKRIAFYYCCRISHFHRSSVLCVHLFCITKDVCVGTPGKRFICKLQHLQFISCIVFTFFEKDNYISIIITSKPHNLLNMNTANGLLKEKSNIS